MRSLLRSKSVSVMGKSSSMSSMLTEAAGTESPVAFSQCSDSSFGWSMTDMNMPSLGASLHAYFDGGISDVNGEMSDLVPSMYYELIDSDVISFSESAATHVLECASQVEDGMNFSTLFRTEEWQDTIYSLVDTVNIDSRIFTSGKMCTALRLSSRAFLLRLNEKIQKKNLNDWKISLENAIILNIHLQTYIQNPRCIPSNLSRLDKILLQGLNEVSDTSITKIYQNIPRGENIWHYIFRENRPNIAETYNLVHTSWKDLLDFDHTSTSSPFLLWKYYHTNNTTKHIQDEIALSWTNLATTISNKGSVFYKEKQFSYAISLYAKAITIREILLKHSPNDQNTKFDLAKIYFNCSRANISLGHILNAEKNLESCLLYNSNHIRALIDSAILAEMLLDYDAAYSLLQRLEKLQCYPRNDVLSNWIKNIHSQANAKPIRLLKLQYPFSIADVERAFRQLSLHWHPDKQAGKSEAIKKRCDHFYRKLVHAKNSLIEEKKLDRSKSWFTPLNQFDFNFDHPQLHVQLGEQLFDALKNQRNITHNEPQEFVATSHPHKLLSQISNSIPPITLKSSFLNNSPSYQYVPTTYTQNFIPEKFTHFNLHNKSSQNNIYTESTLENVPEKCTQNDAYKKCTQKTVPEESTQKNVPVKYTQKYIYKLFTEKNVPEKCIEKNKPEKYTEKNVPEKCTAKNAPEKCTEKNVPEYCTENYIYKKCTKNYIYKKCTENNIYEKCTENNIFEKCTEKNMYKKYSENNISKKCTENDVREKFTENFIPKNKCSENNILKKNTSEKNISKKKSAKAKIINKSENTAYITEEVRKAGPLAENNKVESYIGVGMADRVGETGGVDSLESFVDGNGDRRIVVGRRSAEYVRVGSLPIFPDSTITPKNRASRQNTVQNDVNVDYNINEYYLQHDDSFTPSYSVTDRPASRSFFDVPAMGSAIDRCLADRWVNTRKS